MRPMLATKGDHVPTGEEWSHEVKWDGIRILADVRAGGRRAAPASPAATATTSPRPGPTSPTSPLGDRDLLVDGEIIALNDAGMPDFRVLQERMHVRSAVERGALVTQVPVTFMVFDLLRLDGADLTREPLARRARPARRGARRLGVAGAAVLRRRADAARGDAAAGPGGHRQQAARLALPVRGAHTALAEVRPPAPPLLRRRAAGAPRRAPPTGSRRCSSARPPPTVCSTADASAAASAAKQSRLLADAVAGLGPVRQPVRRRGAAGRRARHALVRAGAGRRRRHPRPRAPAAAPAVLPRPARRPHPGRPGGAEQ